MVLHQFAIRDSDRDAVTAWLADPDAVAATPRTAATVLLLRPAGQTLEVFLMRRRASMAFAGRMHAFPGGGVDPRDSDQAELPWFGPGPREWGQALGCPVELASALVCAAVRELFEECGVLLAGPSGETVVGDVSGEDWERDRQALLDRSLALSELLVRRGLTLRSDLLRPWAHWLTPEWEPRRFDTWFFLAALPEGQIARDVGGEADETEWVELEALARGFAAGRLPMMPPTPTTVGEVAAAAGRRAPGSDAMTAVLGVPRRLSRVKPWAAKVSEDQWAMQVDIDGRGGGRPQPEGS